MQSKGMPVETRLMKFYESEAEKDLTCPKHNGTLDISGYAVRLGLLRAKWAKYLYEEESAQEEATHALSSIYSSKFLYYSYDYEYNIDKKDIATMIKGDKEYQSCELVLKEQISKIKFIQSVLDALSAQTFYLNTAMKHILWKSGETA